MRQPVLNSLHAGHGQSQCDGLTAESYVESLVASSTSAPQVSASPMSEEKLEEFFKEMARYSDRIPILPDEAITRESIYSDHD
jgi:hypothetical protein